jgi:hypothetical protein
VRLDFEENRHPFPAEEPLDSDQPVGAGFADNSGGTDLGAPTRLYPGGLASLTTEACIKEWPPANSLIWEVLGKLGKR